MKINKKGINKSCGEFMLRLKLNSLKKDISQIFSGLFITVKKGTIIITGKLSEIPVINDKIPKYIKLRLLPLLLNLHKISDRQIR